MAIGMGVPRPPIQLVAWGQNDIRAVGVKNRELNVTEALMEFGRVTAGKLNNIRGYILKSGSPSCGKKAKTYTREGKLLGDEAGLFARVLMEILPLLPVEEEKPLDDIFLRKKFLDRVFAYDRLMARVEEGVTIAKLVKFHTENRLLILSRSHDAYDRLEELVANARDQPLAGLMRTYSTEFMNALNYSLVSHEFYPI